MSHDPSAQQKLSNYPNSTVSFESSPSNSRPTVSENSDTLIDLKRLRGITSNDPEQERELIDLYIFHAQETLDQLPKLIADGNAKEVMHLVHKLAGSSSSLGAIGIVAPLRLLELEAQQGQLSNITKMLEGIHLAFEQVKQAFKNILLPSTKVSDLAPVNPQTHSAKPYPVASATFLARQSAPSSASADSLVDLNRFRTISGSDPHHERELANLYISQARDAFNRLPTLIANNDTKEVVRIAHKLAGSSGSLGFQTIIQPLKNLEHQAQQNQLVNPNPWLEQASKQFEALLHWIETYVPGA